MKAPEVVPAFQAEILIIGVNPYVLLPEGTLKTVFAQAEKDKGPIPVRGTLDGHAFEQTLVKFAGAWRLYINGPMRKAAKKSVGDRIVVRIAFDPVERTIPVHPMLAAALEANPEAASTLEAMPPSRRKEVVRYIDHLKSGAAVQRNVARAIAFLLGKERFAGREKR